MTDFSSFFPTAGGGGFTKINKYSTYRSDDATYKMLASIGLKADVNNLQSSATTSVYYLQNSGQDMTAADAFVGYNIIINGDTYVITSSGANSGTYSPFNITTTNNGQAIPISFNWFAADPPKTFNAGPITVNPATDLGLADGASIGYFLCGAGYSGDSVSGGRGGKITSGTAIITNASTDLVLTPGVANGTNSTITGGLTLSSGNGSNASGFGDFNQSNVVCFAAGSGVMGYGVGGGQYSSQRNAGSNYHGYGVGSYSTGDAGDGAILLSY